MHLERVEIPNRRTAFSSTSEPSTGQGSKWPLSCSRSHGMDSIAVVYMEGLDVVLVGEEYELAGVIDGDVAAEEAQACLDVFLLHVAVGTGNPVA